MIRRIVCVLTLLTFVFAQVITPSVAQVASAAGFQPSVLMGLKIHPENPLLFDFIVDRGQAQLSDEQFKTQTILLVKYFLAALTIPDKDSWVNLSPTEKDRIIPDALGRTEMGKTMLEQDYLLKQLASSLTNPETELGRKYWGEVDRKSPGTGRDDQKCLSKVWIVPEKAKVIESNGVAMVDEKRLKVLMEEEYKNREISESPSQIFRSLILPRINQEINESKDFAPVRQIYNSVILAAWYKQALKESLLGKIYADQAKVAGVETDDKQMKQRVYEQYLEAFKKGAYNFIKEQEDPATGETVPRKYFSGGILAGASSALERETVSSAVIENKLNVSAPTLEMVTVAGTESQERNVLAERVVSSPVRDQELMAFLAKAQQVWEAIRGKVQAVLGQDDLQARSALHAIFERKKRDFATPRGEDAPFYGIGGLLTDEKYLQYFERVQNIFADVLGVKDELEQKRMERISSPAGDTHPGYFFTSRAVFVPKEDAHITLVSNVAVKGSQIPDVAQELQMDTAGIPPIELMAVGPEMMPDIDGTIRFTTKDPKVLEIKQQGLKRAEVRNPKGETNSVPAASMPPFFHSSVVYILDASKEELGRINERLEKLRAEMSQDPLWIRIDTLTVETGSIKRKEVQDPGPAVVLKGTDAVAASAVEDLEQLKGYFPALLNFGNAREFLSEYLKDHSLRGERVKVLKHEGSSVSVVGGLDRALIDYLRLPYMSTITKVILPDGNFVMPVRAPWKSQPLHLTFPGGYAKAEVSLEQNALEEVRDELLLGDDFVLDPGKLRFIKIATYDGKVCESFFEYDADDTLARKIKEALQGIEHSKKTSRREDYYMKLKQQGQQNGQGETSGLIIASPDDLKPGGKIKYTEIFQDQTVENQYPFADPVELYMKSSGKPGLTLLGASSSVGSLSPGMAKRVDDDFYQKRDVHLQKLRTIEMGKSLDEVLDLYKSESIPVGTMRRIKLDNQEVLRELQYGKIDGLGFEISLSRIRGTDEWVVIKGEERELIIRIVSNYSDLPAHLFDVMIHNHRFQAAAFPSNADLTFFYDVTEESKTRFLIRGRHGITVVDVTGALDQTSGGGLLRFLLGKIVEQIKGKNETEDAAIIREGLEDLKQKGLLKTQFIPWNKLDETVLAPVEFIPSEEINSLVPSAIARAVNALDLRSMDLDSRLSLVKELAAGPSQAFFFNIYHSRNLNFPSDEAWDRVTGYFLNSPLPVVKAMASMLMRDQEDFIKPVDRKDKEHISKDELRVRFPGVGGRIHFMITDDLDVGLSFAANLNSEEIRIVDKEYLEMYLERLTESGMRRQGPGDPLVAAAEFLRKKWGLAAPGASEIPQFKSAARPLDEELERLKDYLSQNDNPLGDVQQGMRMFRENKKIGMDIGFGDGDFGEAVAKLGQYNVVGIDPFRERKAVSPGAVFLKAFGEEIFDALPDHSLDFVTIFNPSRVDQNNYSSGNVDDRVFDLLRRGVIQRKLKPGGLLIVKPYWEATRQSIDGLKQEGYPFEAINEQEMKRLFGLDAEVTIQRYSQGYDYYIWKNSSSTLGASSAVGTISAPSVSSSAVGGIDFDTSKLNLQIKRDGHGVPLPLPQQNIDQIHIDGLFPVIINVQPVNAQTLPLLLGQNTPSEPGLQPSGV